MEAVPRMPMIWLDLKEAGEFGFHQAVKKFVLKNYGENPENYNEELKKLEQLRQSAVNVPRDFEGCSILRKYFGQLHYLQSRIPMGAEHEAAVPVTWTEIFSGKAVTHEDIKYEQACILYNLGALHSMLGAMDKRVSEEGMKVSCTHFQCAAGAFTYLRDHFPHSYSVDMSHQILNLNINLMLGQAQECLLEKSMLDNRKSFLVARISAQVVDYYKEACRALENSETASLLGKIQKDWKKLAQMKIYYFAAVAHALGSRNPLSWQVIYFQSALDKLNEAIKLAKVQRGLCACAPTFRYASAKKDNDFIYHEAVPALDTVQSVKGAPLVKALPVNPTDPAVTGPDIFAKLVPMAAHEASSLYSEEKAKLLREVMAKIEAKNEVLEQFMDSLQLDPETIDNLDMYNHIPPVLMEKCAALSVRPETVKNLVQSMQVLSGVFTDVEASLREIKELLDEDEAQEQKLREVLSKLPPPPQGSPPPHLPASPVLAEVAKEWAKYMEAHEKASFTNTELHKAMNLHISSLKLLSGPLEHVRAALPAPSLTEEEKQVLQNLKRILAKVQEMKDQRVSLEQQLREMIQKDDLTTSLVTTDRSEMKKLFEEQLKKYGQIRVYLEQNLAAQENVLKALTEANVKYAAVRKVLAEVERKWNSTLQTLVASYEAYEDLMKKSQEGKDFYADLESKVVKLLEKGRGACKAAEAARQQSLGKEVMKRRPPPRPTTPKPALPPKAPEREPADPPPLASLPLADLPEELRSLPPEVLAAHLAQLPPEALAALGVDPASAGLGQRGVGAAGRPGQAPRLPFGPGPLAAAAPLPGHYQPTGIPTCVGAGPFSTAPGPAPVPSHAMQPSAPQTHLPPMSPPPATQLYPPGTLLCGPAMAPLQPAYPGAPPPPPRTSPQHLPMPLPAPGGSYGLGQPTPSSGALPAPQPMPLGARHPPAAPGPFAPGMPPHPAQAIRPASTTVDSIRGPIPSCAASRGGAGPPLQWAGLPPQGGFVGAQAPGAPFPYAQASGPPFVQRVLAPFSAAQPQQSFPPHGHVQPVGRGLDVPPAPSPALAQMPGGAVVPGQALPSPAPLPQPPLRPPSGPCPGPLPQLPPSSLAPGAAPLGASTDDLLSSSPESQHGGPKAPVGQPLLQPTKADAKEGLRPRPVQLIERDPYQQPERLRRLLSELGRFRELVACLGEPGPGSALGGVWKALQEAQEKDARQRSIAVARCYSRKNRHQDVMPYDRNRVVLQSGRDDYINASRIEELSSYCPTVIATQAPLPGTAADFWLMIHEQKVSVVVMLVSELEVEKQKVVCYFPTERGQPMLHGPISLVLTSHKATPTHVERMVTLQFRDQSLKRTVVHLQFSCWPELGLPDRQDDLLHFIRDVHSHYLHQRPLHTPIVVHCSSGVGRTGAFCLLYAAMQEVEAGNSIPDLAQLVRRMRQQRKHMLQEKLHLKFCYESVLRHATQVLQRHGVTAPSAVKPSSGAAPAAQKVSPYVPQDPQDLVLGGDMPISSIQATIAKLSIRPPAGGAESAANGQLPEPSPPIAAGGDALPAPPAALLPQPGSGGLQPPPEAEAPAAPSSSSLDLLASLTPEAFTLDGSLTGRHRMSKQSFLQPQNGEGLRGARPSDDPLDMLDPLWTLNKT
uniref:Tyrosine-protein phosphatase non-receptor type 23 n=1 Tax=Varanus komodoensis TaxID=61221 RepID=A0A8D2JG41_VARKO